MREILFRGKRLDNGEWVEGSLLVLDADSGYYFITEPYKSASTLPVKDLIYNHTHLVNPETVCQYTGLTDKSGVKIFEGDVVAFTRVNALGWNTHRVGEVRYYDELPIFYIMASTGDAWDWVDCENIEVIGNIFDNPELMEGGVADET